MRSVVVAIASIGSQDPAQTLVYRKCDAQHLQHYLTEICFNRRSGLGVNDTMRAEALLKGIEGKRA